MAISQKRSLRKASGGRYKSKITKRLRDLGESPRYTKIGERTARVLRTEGGNKKTILLKNDAINVYDSKNKKYVKTKILSVVENPANRHFIRRNILTKGAVVKTELGNVKITSRPGQEGTINGVLV
ncbi:MAG: 30S ribosomal protein S8e [Nanoarchaeota archaeon]|nr:30S ribosomal protein S8e [Nanoarchaeota archaeon]